MQTASHVLLALSGSEQYDQMLQVEAATRHTKGLTQGKSQVISMHKEIPSIPRKYLLLVLHRLPIQLNLQRLGQVRAVKAMVKIVMNGHRLLIDDGFECVVGVGECR